MALLAACGSGKTGYVNTFGSGNSGNSFSTVFVPTQVDEQKATSGEIGCAPNSITIEDVEDSEGTRSWTAICMGDTYFCSYDSGNTSCSATGKLEKEEAAAREEAAKGRRKTVRSVRPPEVPAPQGAAGFELGASVEACKTACETAGNTWEETEESSLCSGTPEAIGLPAKARLRFCEKGLCEIVLVAQPPGKESSSWIDTFAKLSSALEKKYGAANIETRLIPPRCRDTFADCLASGDAELSYNWVWSKASGVELAMDRATGEAAIRLQYKRLPKKKGAPVEIKSDAL
ncbi:MAG TPA: hypothetical protein VM686_34830 [Polyangiaceae bacterium]|nr:hypothetical protein [Polyangiaceae bacterium]